MLVCATYAGDVLYFIPESMCAANLSELGKESKMSASFATLLFPGPQKNLKIFIISRVLTSQLNQDLYHFESVNQPA
jgi:hypothetical protein